MSIFDLIFIASVFTTVILFFRILLNLARRNYRRARRAFIQLGGLSVIVRQEDPYIRRCAFLVLQLQNSLLRDLLMNLIRELLDALSEFLCGLRQPGVLLQQIKYPGSLFGRQLLPLEARVG